jgi:hypothetical protein
MTSSIYLRVMHADHDGIWRSMTGALSSIAHSRLRGDVKQEPAMLSIATTLSEFARMAAPAGA